MGILADCSAYKGRRQGNRRAGAAQQTRGVGG